MLLLIKNGILTSLMREYGILPFPKERNIFEEFIHHEDSLGECHLSSNILPSNRTSCPPEFVSVCQLQQLLNTEGRYLDFLLSNERQIYLHSSEFRKKFVLIGFLTTAHRDPRGSLLQLIDKSSFISVDIISTVILLCLFRIK